MTEFSFRGREITSPVLRTVFAFFAMIMAMVGMVMAMIGMLLAFLMPIFAIMMLMVGMLLAFLMPLLAFAVFVVTFPLSLPVNFVLQACGRRGFSEPAPGGGFSYVIGPHGFRRA